MAEENIKYQVVDEDSTEQIDNIKIKPTIDSNKQDAVSMEQRVEEFKQKYKNRTTQMYIYSIIKPKKERYDSPCLIITILLAAQPYQASLMCSIYTYICSFSDKSDEITKLSSNVPVTVL